MASDAVAPYGTVSGDLIGAVAYFLCESVPDDLCLGSAPTMAVAPVDQEHHIWPSTRAAEELFAYADAFNVSWMSLCACTHRLKVWESRKISRDTNRERSQALEWVKRLLAFDGRDRESCCDGGSTGVEDEENK